MNLKLKEKIRESLSAVLPITGIVLMISIFLIPMELGTIVMFLTGAIMLIVGMGFFQLGAEMSMTPIGEGVGVQISKLKKLITVLLTGLIMGIIITISEPDLQILANQVPSVPNMVLIITVALGVGLFLALALVRIRYDRCLRRGCTCCINTIDRNTADGTRIQTKNRKRHPDRKSSDSR